MQATNWGKTVQVDGRQIAVANGEPEAKFIAAHINAHADLIASLREIATIEANSNSDPDVMATALDNAIATAQAALRKTKGE